MSAGPVRKKNMQIVLREAMKLFAANGVENTSVEMIARKTDLSLRSVQNYFPTKGDLIAAVLQNGYALELEEMKAFFASESYKGKTGAGQILEIVSVSLDKAVEHSDIVFCTSQLQHIVSRMPDAAKDPKLTGNWPYFGEQLQKAFDTGVSDGSITKAVEERLIDAKCTMLALRGIQEAIAYTMCDQEFCRFFDPRSAVKKYVHQVELMLSLTRDGESPSVSKGQFGPG